MARAGFCDLRPRSTLHKIPCGAALLATVLAAMCGHAPGSRPVGSLVILKSLPLSWELERGLNVAQLQPREGATPWGMEGEGSPGPRISPGAELSPR